MAGGGKESELTIEKATVAYLQGELSSEKYVEIIKNNPDRPDYKRLAQRSVAGPQEKR